MNPFDKTPVTPEVEAEMLRKIEAAEVCIPGCTATIYRCPSSGETECPDHGGFDNCCDHPECPGNRGAA